MIPTNRGYAVEVFKLAAILHIRADDRTKYIIILRPEKKYNLKSDEHLSCRANWGLQHFFITNIHTYKPANKQTTFNPRSHGHHVKHQIFVLVVKQLLAIFSYRKSVESFGCHKAKRLKGSHLKLSTTGNDSKDTGYWLSLTFQWSLWLR